MKYYYSTVDDVVLTHGEVEEQDDIDFVRFYFERATEKGFDFAEGKIPYYQFDKCYGFSEDELFKMEKYLRNNALLIWEFAGKGGAINA